MSRKLELFWLARLVPVTDFYTLMVGMSFLLYLAFLALNFVPKIILGRLGYLYFRFFEWVFG